MNYRKPFFVLLAGVLLLSAAPGRSQTFENPSIQGSSSFAVITDSRTARECRPQMTAYKQTLEAEGLPVYIVSHDWTTPEQVRDVLRKLYAENALEGCVFIGDVPIAMITKAQHLTSAFKMDERDHPLHETSVPSDRFYDDFDLQFAPQGTPSQGLFHYYEMSPDSPQYISCDIYSGRIKAQKAYGDPYKQIARYLEKAVAEHRDATPFDQFVSYTGHGSYSNSLIAWRDEQQLLDEQFGDVFSRTHNAKFLRYSMQPFVKESLIREVRRDDVDMMVFHEHGMPHRQYLSGTPYVESAEDAAAEMQRSLRELARRPGSGRESAAKRAAEKGLDSTWYNRAEEPEMLRLDSIADLRTGIILEEVEAIAPNARFVVFDACYNGDYREDDFIAGHYIMAPGRCVTTFANSVNVLQDKSAFDLLGLLGEGLRIGAWAKNIHILESHVIGDPTYRFKAAHPELDINSMALKRNNGFWLGQLDNAIPDIQNLAMIRLWENDYPQLLAILLDKCSESPYSVVRYNAFRLLESLNGPEYKQALMLAAYDRFEFLRRIAVTRMGRIGDEAFISVLIDVYVRDRNAARIVFNISEAIRCFDKQQVEKAIETYFADKNFYHAREEKQELLDKLIERNELSPGESSTREILDPQGKPRWRQARISFLKNRPYHQHVTEYLTLLGDEQVPEILRVRMAEALAWFNLSVRRHEIADAGRKLLARGNCSPELAKEVQRMINRVESKK